MKCHFYSITASSRHAMLILLITIAELQ